MNHKYTQKEKIYYALKRAKGIPLHIDVSLYMHYAKQVQDEQGRAKLTEKSADELRQIFQNGDLIQTYAAVSEAAYRCTGLQPYTEQIAAGRILSENKLVQMQTGEGKTLSAIFPVLLNAKRGIRTHVFTANEYLAQRDARWMGIIYSFFGFNTGWITEEMAEDDKRAAYLSEITYLTAKQAGFDYLHDCICMSSCEKLQQPSLQQSLVSCIVDEADFILIDEARIPLVIAREKSENILSPQDCQAMAIELEVDEDFTLDRVGRNCVLTSAGINKVCCRFNLDEISESGRIAVSGVNVALHALRLLTRDIDYIVREESIELVDELTGRVAENREWPFGIQRALEAKEGLPIRNEGEICGTITIENFILLYSSISAMTATAETSAAEFNNKYGLEVYILPQHKTCIRHDLPDMIFRTEKSKYKKMITMINEAVGRRQPVIIGTASVMESETVSKLLEENGIAHCVLNAAQDAEEAAIIAGAGCAGRVTVSTNMAGRGTDIMLGGPEKLESRIVREAGGLFVIGLNRHESKRIDDQLRGRAGRQGDPGKSQFLLSLEDKLFKRYGIEEFIPDKVMNFEGEQPLIDKKVAREVCRAQEIIDDQFATMRATLHSYSKITEKYRQHVISDRDDAISRGEFPLDLVECIENSLTVIKDNATALSTEVAVEKAGYIYAAQLDQFWIEYLEWDEHIREGIHMRRYGRQEPLIEYVKDAELYYKNGLNETVSNSCRLIEQYGLIQAEHLSRKNKSGSTWTYQIDDNPFPSFSLSLLGMDNAVAAATGFMLVLAWPVFLWQWAYKKQDNHIKKL